MSKCNTEPVRANKVHLASRGTASRHSTANYSAFRQTEFQICRDISTAINGASGICLGHSFDPITNGKLSDISSSLINDCIYEISYIRVYSFRYTHIYSCLLTRLHKKSEFIGTIIKSIDKLQCYIATFGNLIKRKHVDVSS